MNASLGQSLVTVRQPRWLHDAQRRVRYLLSASALCTILALAPPVQANPQGGVVVRGDASIGAAPGSVVVNQRSGKTVINWNGFSVENGETTQFNQPHRNAIALNRVVGRDASRINGRVKGNGNVWLVNQNGVMIGPKGEVQTGGFLATTTDIGDDDFMAGHYRFDRPSPNPNASVVNRGKISVGQRGLGALVAPHARNDGVIEGQLASVVIGGAQTYTVDLYGDGLIQFDATSKVTRKPDGAAALAENTGRITTPGGRVLITAQAAEGIVDNVINVSGKIEARSVATQAGSIVLQGGDRGTVQVNGTLDASGVGVGRKGGKIDVRGQRILVDNGAFLDASGTAGGGAIRIGGDARGRGPGRNAQATVVMPGARVKADARATGNGGSVIVYADDLAKVHGQISARGGAQGGNGGFIETSGKQWLDVRRAPDVGAPRGRAGTWLIDPADLTIGRPPSENLADSGAATNPRIFSPTANTSILDFKVLQDALTGAANVRITTVDPVRAPVGTQAGDITFGVPVVGTSTGTLTVSAAGGVYFNSSLTLAGSLAVTAHGVVQFNSSLSLGNLLTPAGRGNLAVTSNGGAITAGVSGSLAVAGTSSFNAGANHITLNNPSNDFKGPVSLRTTRANNVILRDANDLTLGAVSVPSGNLRVDAVRITQSDLTAAGAIFANTAVFNGQAGVITLNNPNNDFTGAVTLSNTGANSVTLADKNLLTLAHVATTDALTLWAGTFTGLGNIQPGVKNLKLTATRGGIALPTLNLTGTLEVSAQGAIEQTAVLVVRGSSTFDAHANAITLDQVGNDFTGAVSLNNTGRNNVKLFDQNALNLGPSAVGSGTLTVRAVEITQSGAVTQAAAVVGTAASFDGGIGAITLDNPNNDFTGAVSLTSGGPNQVRLVDRNALQLGASSIAADLSVTAGDAIRGTGQLIVGGAATFTTRKDGGAPITVGDSASYFAAVAARSLATAGVNVAGGTVLLSQSGVMTIVDLATTGTLGLTAATFSGLGNLQPGVTNLSLTATGGGINLPSLNVTGRLDVSAQGAIDQVGALGPLRVGGASRFDAHANAIALDNPNNDFGGAVSLRNSGLNNVTLFDQNGLNLGLSSVGSGTLTVQALSGITQSGAVTQAAGAGAVSFNGGVGVITLGNSVNDFTGAVSLNNAGAYNVTLSDRNALDLGVSSVGSGTLRVRALTGISQSGAVTQAAGARAASFDGGAGAIALGHVGNDFTGAVSLTSTSDVSLFGNHAPTSGVLTLGAVSTGGADTLTVTAGHGITQSDHLTAAGAVLANAAGFDGGAGAIILDNPGNDFTGAVTLTNSGAADITLVDRNALALDQVTTTGTLTLTAGTFSVLGIIQPGVTNLNLMATAGGITLPNLNVIGALDVSAQGAINQRGALVVGGSSRFDAHAAKITLGNLGNDFTGAVSLSNSGTNSVTLRDRNALNLGVSRVGSGTLRVQALTGITQSGALTQAAGAGAASVDGGAGVITLDNANNDFTGAVLLSNSGTDNVTLRDRNALELGVSSVGSGTLTVQATGITQSGALTQAAGAGAASFDGGAGVITLDHPSNNFTGAVSLTNSGANNVTLRDRNALDLGVGSVGSGTLTVRAVGITQSGALTQAAGAGLASFDGGVGVITLDNDNNDFTGAVSLTNSGASNVNIRDRNVLDLGVSRVGSGTLRVQALTGITQSGALTQAAGAGAASVDGGAGVITLDNANNDFTGTVLLSNSGANDVALRDRNALDLGVSSVGSGTLTLRAVGITQSGALTQAAGAGAVSVDGGAGVITLDNANNDFTGAVLLSNSGANNVTLRDRNALNLGVSRVGSGTLRVRALTGITQSGVLTQAAGAGVASVDGGAGVITLDNANNDFTGAVLLSNSGANNVTLRDRNALNLGVSRVGSGTLRVQALAGITQSGVLTQAAGAGAASVDGGAGVITLDNVNNDFTGAVSLSNSGANNVTLRDRNALNLGVSRVGSGTLRVQALAGITQSGVLTQAAGAGAASVDGGAGVITLDNVNNDFTGAVSLSNSGANNVTVVDRNALILAPSKSGGDLKVSTLTNTLSVEGNLSVGGVVSLQAADLLTINAPLSGATVDLIGGTGITHGVAGDVTARGALSATATTGDLRLADGTVYTAGGPLTLLAGCHVLLGRVAAGTNLLSVTATTGSIGAVAARRGPGQENLVAGDLRLVAATGIGAVDHLDLSALTLDARTTGAGSIDLAATGGLHVGKRQGLRTGAADELIRIGTVGPMTVAQTITTTGTGLVDLSTSSGGGLTVDAAVSGGATIWLHAAGLLTINAAVAGGSVDLIGGTGISHGAAGDVTARRALTAIATTGDLAMADGTLYQAGGKVRLEAARNVALGRVAAGGNPISVIARTGAIRDSTAGEAGGSENLVAGDLTLLAATGIGAPGAAADLDIAVNRLDAHATTGGIDIAETDQIQVGNRDPVRADGGADLSIAAGGALTIGKKIVVAGDGNVVLTTHGPASDVLLLDGVQVDTGNIELTAGGSILNPGPGALVAAIDNRGTLALRAGVAIGSRARPVQTDVAVLAAGNSGSEGIAITQIDGLQDNLTVGTTLGPNPLAGITAQSGDISLLVLGTGTAPDYGRLDISKPITVLGSGEISLETKGLQSDLFIGARLINGGGKVKLTAGRRVISLFDLKGFLVTDQGTMMAAMGDSSAGTSEYLVSSLGAAYAVPDFGALQEVETLYLTGGNRELWGPEGGNEEDERRDEAEDAPKPTPVTKPPQARL